MCQQIVRVLDKAQRTMNLMPEEAAVLRRERARFQAALRFCQGKKAFFAGDTKTAIEDLTEANTFFRSSRISLVLFLVRIVPRFLRRAYDIRKRFLGCFV